tara:strand:+ start:4186 stop:4821 length:636 start_codon:yes stop_codon:yes gene_type:complete
MYKFNTTNNNIYTHPTVQISNKKINLILLGPHKSGKTLLINSLSYEPNVHIIHSSYSMAMINETFQLQTYQPSPIIEKYLFNISHMFMDLDITDTSGSQVYMSILKNICKDIDITLLILNADHDDISEFKNFYATASNISSQTVIVIINTSKYTHANNTPNHIHTLEVFCVNNNIFHVKLNVATDIQIILHTIRSFMFSKSEYNLIKNNNK